MRILALPLLLMVALPALAQEEKLQSVLVRSDSAADKQDTNTKEPAEDLSLLQTLPPRDRVPNPIPGIEPIPTPAPTPTLLPPTNQQRVPARPASASLRTPQPTNNPKRLPDSGLRLDGKLPVVRGVIVGSLADQAGLRPGDRIDALGDKKVRSREELIQRFARHPGAMELTVTRRGQQERLLLPAPQTTIRRPRVAAQPVTTQTPPKPTPATPAASPASAANRSPSATRSNERRHEPLIGDGGRIIGNGRVINSFRRLLRGN